MGGFSPAIEMFGGGELGGEGVQTRETGTELLGGKGNSGGFREKDTGLKGAEVGVGTTVGTVMGGGVAKPGVGKYSRFLGLDQAATSREIGVTNLSPYNPRSGGENSIGTLPKFSKRETPTRGLIGN
jgi:hypothetical protein